MVELAGIIILGIFAQWLAWKIRVPAILPLILLGLLVGPLATLYMPDGQKVISPIYNELTDTGLFPNRSLFYFVSLAIGIILFEGGLTLKRKEIKEVGPAILRLITVGSSVTFIGAGLAAHLIMGLSWPISFLFAALIIVTGPTVITPILQNIPLNRNVSTVLKWEGILIDPIGALVAVVVFEFIRSAEGGMAFTSHAFITFTNIILIGFALGVLAAYTLYQLLKHDLVPHYLLNVFTLAFVLGMFVLSDVLAHESGLLSVVVMGMVLGNLEVPRLKEILSFKESVSVLLISILFILLAANIDMADLYLLFENWRALALFGFVALVLRPVAVFLSTRHGGLSLREKIFISWMGPRGIVAAGIASLFGLILTEQGVPDAEYITPLVFMIVLGTVLLNATTARLVARLLGVTQDASNGVLIIGANTASRTIARYLRDQGRHVVLVDNNSGNIAKARREGLEAVEANIYTADLTDQFELLDMGYLLAMTSSNEINEFAVSHFKDIFGERGSFRLITGDELKHNPADLPQQGILSYHDDFINISETVRDYPHVHEMLLHGKEHLLDILSLMQASKHTVPLFIKYPDGQLHPLPATPSEIKMVEGDYHLVYLGQKIEQDLSESFIGADQTKF